MTVKRIHTMHRQQLNTAVANDPAVLTKFRSGFSECASEVSRFINRLENVDSGVKQRLIAHLNKCAKHLQQMVPLCSHYVPCMPERLYPEVKVGFQSDFQNGDENNNGSARIQIPNGVQLIPSRLPTGELALLVPQSAGISANFPFFPPITESSARVGQSSGFTTGHRSQSPLSSSSTSSYGDESHHSEHPQATSPNSHQPHSSRVRPIEPSLSEPSPASFKSFSSLLETQRPHIVTSDDRKSPVPAFRDHGTAMNDNTAAKQDATRDASHTSGSATHNNLRQPLSVITDRTSNCTSWSASSFTERCLKRRKLERLLEVDKRTKYQEPSSSTSSMNNGEAFSSMNERSVAIDGSAARRNSPTPHNPNPNSDKFPTNPVQGPCNANGDMWRPWWSRTLAGTLAFRLRTIVVSDTRNHTLSDTWDDKVNRCLLWTFGNVQE